MGAKKASAITWDYRLWVGGRAYLGPQTQEVRVVMGSQPLPLGSVTILCGALWAKGYHEGYGTGIPDSS